MVRHGSLIYGFEVKIDICFDLHVDFIGAMTVIIWLLRKLGAKFSWSVIPTGYSSSIIRRHCSLTTS